MKRVAIFLMTASLMTWAVGASFAGDYHTGGTDADGQPLLKCAQCHTMHRSQQHGYYDPTPGSPTVFSAVGPQPALLKDKVNEMCLSCHNRATVSIIDVFGSIPAPSTELRQAGALNVKAGAIAGLSNDPGYEETNGHTLYSTAVAPGGLWSNATEGLNCVDCHMPHGHVKTQWRNLWTSTNSQDKFNLKDLNYSNDAAAPDKQKDIWEIGAEKYDQAEVWFNERNQSLSPYADWCKSCHTNFHGAAGPGTEVGGQSGGWTFQSQVDWVRHPNADVNIGHQAGADYVSSLARYQSLTNKVKVMSNTATTVAEWEAGPTDATPSCFSCHKGHGNKNPFGLILMKGTGTVSEEGDVDGLASLVGPPSAPSRVSAPTPLCQQCHIQGE